jgi:DNA-binding response OmpR family regulator
MRRILVVDDDPHICLAIRAWLKRYGFGVSIGDGGASKVFRPGRAGKMT